MSGPSPAVRAAAPPLWVPDDVGLVVVSLEGRATTVKKAPRREPRRSAATVALAAAAGMEDKALADLVRWVSVRPDPRHAALRAAASAALPASESPDRPAPRLDSAEAYSGS